MAKLSITRLHRTPRGDLEALLACKTWPGVHQLLSHPLCPVFTRVQPSLSTSRSTSSTSSSIQAHSLGITLSHKEKTFPQVFACWLLPGISPSTYMSTEVKASHWNPSNFSQELLSSDSPQLESLTKEIFGSYIPQIFQGACRVCIPGCDKVPREEVADLSSLQGEAVTVQLRTERSKADRPVPITAEQGVAQHGPTFTNQTSHSASSGDKDSIGRERLECSVNSGSQPQPQAGSFRQEGASGS